MLPPFSVGYCKGWKRATLALICLQAARELDLGDKISHRIKARSICDMMCSCVLILPSQRHPSVQSIAPSSATRMYVPQSMPIEACCLFF